MKKHIYLLLLTLVMVSCGTDGSHFKLNGRLLNLNQGEFYVYSTDGVMQGIDTVHVKAGRFSYTTPCSAPGTLVFIFPNFSEHAVFAAPGKTADMKGDVGKLKELKITGTDENKLMNKFREMTAGESPKRTQSIVENFVENHPTSLVPIFLVQKYFIKTEQPDYKKAAKLLQTLAKAQPENGRLAQLSKSVSLIAKSSVGMPLPQFSATDTKGNKISSKDFAKGDAIIYLWASWEWESTNIMRILRDADEAGIKTLGICIDTSQNDCDRSMKNNTVESPIVRVDQMFDSPLVRQLGITSIPGNLVLHNGKIVERNLPTAEIREKVKR